MTGARQTWLRHRLAVLLIPLATVAVHQLRYVLAYGSGAGHEFAASGDEYVGALVPELGLLAVVALGLAAASGWRAARGRTAPARRVPSLWHLWAGAALVLLAGYVVQESLEVLLGSAHASILGQAFAHGGWWVGPAAAVVGLGWALAVRGSRAVLAYAVRRARAPHRRPAGGSLAVLRRRACAFRLRLSPLARRLAGRAPPLLPS